MKKDTPFDDKYFQRIGFSAATNHLGNPLDNIKEQISLTKSNIGRRKNEQTQYYNNRVEEINEKIEELKKRINIAESIKIQNI